MIEMDRYCIIDIASNTVFNVIIWDGTTPYQPPAGTFLFPADDQVEVGWLYDPDTQTYYAWS